MNKIAGLRDDFLDLDECASTYKPDQHNSQKKKNE